MAYRKIILSTATLLLFAVSCNSFKISTRDYCPPKPATINPFDPTKVHIFMNITIKTIKIWCTLFSFAHPINFGWKSSKNNRLPKFTPGLTYDVNNSKIWVQFFCLHGLARKCHFCILTMLNQLISGLKKKF